MSESISKVKAVTCTGKESPAVHLVVWTESCQNHTLYSQCAGEGFDPQDNNF